MNQRNVKTLAEVITATESLDNFQWVRDSTKDKGKKVVEEEKDHEKPKSYQSRGKVQERARDKAHPKGGRKGGKCFLCDEDHWTRDCPKRQKLSAIVAKLDEESEP